MEPRVTAAGRELSLVEREPLLGEALKAAVPALVVIVTAFGLDISPAVENAVQTLVMLAALGFVWWRGRRKVTPTVDPRDASGRRLVPSVGAVRGGDGRGGS